MFFESHDCHEINHWVWLSRLLMFDLIFELIWCSKIAKMVSLLILSYRFYLKMTKINLNSIYIMNSEHLRITAYICVYLYSLPAAKLKAKKWNFCRFWRKTLNFSFVFSDWRKKISMSCIENIQRSSWIMSATYHLQIKKNLLCVNKKSSS